MAPPRRKARRAQAPAIDPEFQDEPYVAYWRSLTPGQRLIRSWRMRSRLKDIQAIHDAKTFPEL